MKLKSIYLCTTGIQTFILLCLTAGTLAAQPVFLYLQLGNNQVSVSWPSGLGAVQPQKATSLISGGWADFGATITTNKLTDLPGNAAAFYRLRFLAPIILTQPQGQTNAVGSNITFTVTATGTAPINYQWHKDNTPLSGQTNTMLALTNLNTTNAGDYTVLVTNRAGTITSIVAILSVTNPLVRPVGIYMGTFAGEADNGGFGVMLRSNGLAYIVGYNGQQEEGIFATNVSVALNGTFYTPTIQGGKAGGTFTTNAISGNFTNSFGQTGTFAGTRKPDSGIQTANAGYYVGTYNGYATGNAYIMVAADGSVFFYTIDFGGTPGENDGGGFGSINAANSFSATTVPDNLTVTGTLNPTTHVISGSYKSGSTTLGNFSATRSLAP